MGPRRLWRMLAAQLAYQARLLRRSPMPAFTTMVLPVMVLLAVTMLNERLRLPSRGGIGFEQFFTPAMVAFAAMSACYVHILTSTAVARERGILKRIRGTPLPPWLHLVARVLVAGAVAVVSGIAVVVAGALVYGVTVPWEAMPAAVLVLLAGIGCFAAIAFAVTALASTPESAMALGWGTLLALSFVSDIFLPLDHGPHWVRELASAFPPRHLALALETAFNPVRGSTAPQWNDIAVLAAWGIAATGVAAATFTWEPAAGRPIAERLRGAGRRA